MIENLNIAASGMLAMQQRIDGVANDLANASTNGYKHVRMGFRDLVYNEAGRSQVGGVNEGSGVATVDAGRAFDQGSLQRTDSPLDVAVQGDGFLQVKLPDGRQALTRDGAMHLDSNGTLVTASGAKVQPGLTVPKGTSLSDISISAGGVVAGKGGKRLGTISLVTVRSPQALESVGDNAFIVTQASGAATRAGNGTTLSQGALEASNVDTADEMVQMIDAQRGYQLASKSISTADEMMQIANGIRR
jgi:flagellar basal-body rod protein FlgG